MYWSLVSAHAGYVEEVQFDTYHGRLASVGDGAAQIWKLSAEGKRMLRFVAA